ncbi:MAG: DUF3566 domain-containing protein [Corynebacterium sp.]|nr:DUF3566 domain-containing protein [Corynebacterium sp.]
MALRSRVVVRHIAPGSVFRVALTLSIVGLAAWILCVTLLYFAMSAVGIWDKINSLIGSVGGDAVIGYGTVISVAGGLGLLLALCVIILSPLVALIYNSLVSIFGGVVVVLEEHRN